MEMLPRYFSSDKSKFTCKKYCCSAIKKSLANSRLLRTGVAQKEGER